MTGAGAIVAVVAVLTAAPEGADQLYARGLAHMEAEEFALAAVAFDEAFARDPATALMWNAARAHDKAGHAEAAHNRYQLFLGREDAPADLRTFALERIDALAAELRGQRTEEEDRARLEAMREQLLEELRAEIAQTPAPAGDTAMDPTFVATEAATPRDRGAELAPWGWASVGVGAGLLVVATVLQVHAVSLGGDLDDPDRDASGVVTAWSQVEAHDRSAQAETEAAVAVGGFVLGGALAVTGVTLLLLDGGDEDTVTLGPAPVPGGALLSASGRW